MKNLHQRHVQYLMSQIQKLKSENKTLQKENKSLKSENIILKSNLATTSQEYSDCISKLKDLQKEYRVLIQEQNALKVKYKKEMDALFHSFTEK